MNHSYIGSHGMNYELSIMRVYLGKNTFGIMIDDSRSILDYGKTNNDSTRTKMEGLSSVVSTTSVFCFVIAVVNNILYHCLFVCLQ